MYEALAEREGGPPAGSLAALMDRYRQEVLPTKAPKTQRDQGRQLSKLSEIFGHMSPASVRTAHVAQYLDRYAGVSANREVALLSHVYTKAIRWGLVEVNPCKGVQRNKEKPRTRYVTDEEFLIRLEEVPPKIQELMWALLITGQRLSDVLKITDKDITDAGVYVEQGKTGRRLLLRWTDALQGLTLPLPPMTASGVQSAWKRAEWSGEPFRLHDLRAKSATDHKTGEHLGHKDPRTLAARYRNRKPLEVDGL